MKTENINYQIEQYIEDYEMWLRCGSPYECLEDAIIMYNHLIKSDGNFRLVQSTTIKMDEIIKKTNKVEN
ncbi:hypothetical protein [uncultured Ilyobacter sp.]|uniref:hypothetical protein n=1 Tax=uncultured Ilyobacter sp. TaxID=544433 RepID=UPI0029C60507|nr:hypothetical protein [uncultured Ilyobacter sp.]